MKRLNQLSDFIVTYIPWLFLGYLLFSAWFLHVHLQGEHDAFHTWIDTTYFVFITILTIGYGDVFPTTDAGKSYVIVFILVGACLGSVISGTSPSGSWRRRSACWRRSRGGAHA